MVWIAVDVALALLALTGLALVCLKLWRQTKALGSTLSASSETLAEASAAVPQVNRGAQDT